MSPVGTEFQLQKLFLSVKIFQNIKELINHEFPELTISSIKKIGEGDNSKAFLINQNYIFRFPKKDEVKQHLKKEISVLPKIRSLLNIAIPNFDFISKEINFVGHKSINGEPLTIEIYNSLEKKIQTKIKKSLAVFLTQLHQVNLLILKDCDLDTMDYREEFADNFEDTQRLIYPNISIKDSRIISRLFNAYLNDPKNFKYKPTLIHNDFSADHILFVTSTNEISGIIDFGDLAIGHPDYDLMYLLDTFGEGFILKLLKFYKHNDHKNLLLKLIFFRLANKLQILIESIKDEDEYAIKAGYINLKRWFDNGQLKIEN